jgi:tetratricopeptide (TPR) repeat protein
MKPACEVSHSQILAGNCPWCHCQVGDPEFLTDSTDPVWNIPAMAAALDDSSENVRSMTVTNLMHKGPPLDQAVPLLSKAMRDRSDNVGRMAEQMLLSFAGQELIAEDTQRIEAQMAGSPHELALRILVLGYYFLGQRESDTARSARQNHILWLIEHAPASSTAGSPEASILNRDDPQAYVEARSLWLDQVASHPRDTNILGNAAQFFVLNDFEQSEKLLKQARALEPDNPEWPERLGQLYSLHSSLDAAAQRASAANALREFQAAERLQSQADPQPSADGDPEAIEEAKVTTLLMLIHKLPDLAKAAFDAGEFEHARNYASELLENAVSTDVPEFFRNDGNALHHGNLILGRVALRSGDLEQAKRRLVAAAKVSGSPQLDSFGPDMSLALELLEQGERDVVLEYFQRCGSFWKNGAEHLQEWTSQVEKGVIPDFGPNLRY